MPSKIDAELDLHGYTAATARAQLESVWSHGAWKGLRRVRIIHGTGAVLYHTVRHWADERSIPWTLEAHNPGVTILQPSLRRDQKDAPTNLPFHRYRDALAAAFPQSYAKTDRSAESEMRKPDPPASDLFSEELARLDLQDSRSLQKRKHGL